MIDTSRLKPLLQQTKLAHQNQPLFQLLSQLIDLETKIALIINASGSSGPVGPQGPQGAQGNNGINGIDGNDGSMGPPGLNGSNGPQGLVGPQGIDRVDDTISWPVFPPQLWLQGATGTYYPGNVGIGTKSPQQLLEVNAGANEARIKIFGDNPVLSITGDANSGVNDYYIAARGGAGASAGWLAFGPLSATDAALPATSADNVRFDTLANVWMRNTLSVGMLNTVGSTTERIAATGDDNFYGLLFDNSTSDGSSNKWRVGASGAGWGAGDNKLIFTYETTVSANAIFAFDGPGGRFGVGTTSPTAVCHLKAGTASAGTAPLKLNSGTLLTSAEAGAIEFLTDAYYATITTGAVRKTFAFREDVAVTQASGKSDAQNAAVASITTFTVGATNALFLVAANVDVTVSTVHNFTCTVSYTDETNTARVLTLNFSQLTGAFVTAITNVTGAGPYEGVPLLIRAKAATAITIATTGTFTTVTYNVAAFINQVALT